MGRKAQRQTAKRTEVVSNGKGIKAYGKTRY